MAFDIETLSLEELVGQVLCPDISPRDDPADVEEMIKKDKPGGLFLTRMTAEKIKMYTDMANKYAKVPVIICSDVENGPEIVINGAGTLPKNMAQGASDSPELIEEAGEIAAQICRKNGVHWTFSPVVDINLNFRSPETNYRAISDDPDHVIKIGGAQIRGLQKNGYMVATAKHFPGQGTDDRNSHFVTAINDLSREEWMASYGKIYKEMIAEGVKSIMIGHIALPAYQTEKDENIGYLPAIISKSLMTDLLKGELGFDGCIVSDAMSMVGACAMCPVDKLASRFLAAGGDVVLFNEKNDKENILRAIEEGELSVERLKDAVRRVIRLKEQARLFEDQQAIADEIVVKRPIAEVAQEIADKSICVVRDFNKKIPLKLKENSKILFVNVIDNRRGLEPTTHEFDAMRAEFEKEGHTVDQLITPQHYQLEKIVEDYDAVLVNYKIDVDTYHGGTLRVGWNNIFLFWRAYIFKNPNLIVTSFGDPYKIFDVPYIKEYINAFSFTDESQRAVAKVIMGKIPAQGKNPIQFDGFFDRQV